MSRLVSPLPVHELDHRWNALGHKGCAFSVCRRVRGGILPNHLGPDSGDSQIRGQKLFLGVGGIAMGRASRHVPAEFQEVCCFRKCVSCSLWPGAQVFHLRPGFSKFVSPVFWNFRGPFFLRAGFLNSAKSCPSRLGSGCRAPLHFSERKFPGCFFEF